MAQRGAAHVAEDTHSYHMYTGCRVRRDINGPLRDVPSGMWMHAAVATPANSTAEYNALKAAWETGTHTQ